MNRLLHWGGRFEWIGAFTRLVSTVFYGRLLPQHCVPRLASWHREPVPCDFNLELNPGKKRSIYSRARRFIMSSAIGTCSVLLPLFTATQTPAAAFRDLGFESPTFVSVPSPYQGSVNPTNALPGWIVYWGTNPAPYVLYDNEFLDSAGVSILDTNSPYGYQILDRAFQKSFTALLQGGFSLTSYPARQSVTIAQTGLVPASATTLLFDARLQDASPLSFMVSIAGVNLPLSALASYPGYVVYAADISRFAGQTVEIRFTANPLPPPGLAINNVYLDDIRFTGSPGPPLPPTIVPQNQAAAVGSTVDFVTVTDGLLLTYQWFFNVTNLISYATSPALHLVNVQLSQAGSYTVVVANPFGVLTSPPAILTVTGSPPVIVTSPSSQAASIGDTVDFTVNAAGSPPLMYQWFFNNNPISGASSSDLSLVKVQLNQAGAYTAVITNVFGSATSSPAILTVTGSPLPPGTLAVRRISVAGGCADIMDRLRFTFGYCPGGGRPTNGLFNALLLTTKDVGRVFPIAQADDTNFAFVVSILTNGTADWVGYLIEGACGSGEAALEQDFFSPLPPGGNGIDFAGLHIDNIALEIDQLTFTPSGSGPPWTDFTGSFLLFVNSEPWSRPTILMPPQNQMADVGSTVDFVVSAAGNPPLGYRWFFNDTNFISGGTNSVLELVNVQPAQAGAYTVIVTNRFGAVTSSPAILTLIPRLPTILTPPQSKTAGMGSTVDFVVTADGAPPPAYRWFFNQTNSLSGGTNSILELVNVQPAQAGAYTVVVTNAVGAVTSPPAILTILNPFIASHPVSQLVTLGGTASFSVVAAGTSPVGYQWLKDGSTLNDGANISGAHTATLTLVPVIDADAGGYCVLITNSYGSVTSIVALLNIDRPGFSVLHTFTGYDGGFLLAGLVASGTTLYGTTSEGGSFGQGTVFKVNTDGSGYTLLKQYVHDDGVGPSGDLLLSGTNLYGTTYMGGSHNYGTVFKMSTDGGSYAMLEQFNYVDGGEPEGGLALSGTTLYGATLFTAVLFKVNSDGSGYTVLRRFTSNDGFGPSGSGSLVLSGTTLYGTTQGCQGCPVQQPFGTVFKVNTDGSGYTVLKSFAGSDGSWPYGGLLLSGTTLYGTTYEGGPANYGTVFKLNTDGSGFAVLKHFTGQDGLHPQAGLVLAAATLYGTTYDGGISGDGTVFQVNTDGRLFAVLKSFTGSDGSGPSARLVLSGGTLYGTTAYGGNYNEGVVFSLSSLPPTTSDISAATLQDQPLKLAVAKLLALATSPTDAALVLSGVSALSTNGGLVVLGTNQIIYTPPPGYVGTDSFNYTLSNGAGSYTSGFVFVQVRATNQLSGNLLPLSAIPGGYLVSFAGIPGRTYSVQRASTVTGPWVTLTTVTVGFDGIGTCEDKNPPGGTAFYRTTYP
jgi:uncharacterized repeat protein (TIGR03803 family)